MAENDDNDNGSSTPGSGDQPTAETSPVLPPDASAPAQPAQPVLVTRWRDRAWSFRAMLAVALATLLIGGVAGGTIVAVADDDGHPDHGRFLIVPGGGRADRMPPGWHGPYRFRDGGPQWRWNDGQQPPDTNSTPNRTPTPSETPNP